MLINLLTNSVDYTQDGGTITVQAERNSDGGIDLKVADTGVGIAKEDIPLVLAHLARPRMLTPANSTAPVLAFPLSSL